MKSKRWILPILAGVILGLSVYRWNAETLTGNRMPMPFGYGASVVLSGSMEPALHVDDLVIVRQSSDIAPGDVVVYQSGDILVIHRVVSATVEEIVTRGDANNVSDDPISPEDVKGVVICAIPKIGGLVWALKKPQAVILLLALLVLLNERSFRKERKRKDQELDELREQLHTLADEIKSGE